MQYRHILTDGRQLRAARVMAGLTVREMADIIGMNRNSVMRIEAFKALPFHTCVGDRIVEALKEQGIDFVIQDGKPSVFFSGATERIRKQTLK